jgi:putative transposase
MIVKKAYNIRLYPTKGQANFINKTIGGCKFAYNLCLKSKQYLYKNYGASYEPKMALLVKEYPEQLGNIDSQGLCNAYMDLRRAYSNWFNSLLGKNKGNWNAPRLKDLKSKSGSYRNAQIRKEVDKLVQDNKIFLPCAKLTKFKGTIEKDKIRKIYNITVKRTNSGKYFASLCCDVEVDEYEHTGEAIGLDLGIKDLIIDSNGTKYDNKKFLKESERKIKHLQREFSRKKKGSHNREKARIKLAIAYEKLSNRRNNYLHQLTTKIVKENSIICIEDLNVKGMMKNHKLAKSIADCSFSTIRRMLEYKCQWHNRQLIVIDRWSPSSKTCNSCGYVMKDWNLGIREWDCTKCGKHHDRDINAAKNILDEGMKTLDTVGTTGSACGVDSSVV